MLVRSSSNNNDTHKNGKEVLVLGAEGSGKSLLTKKIIEGSRHSEKGGLEYNYSYINTTIPTIGMEMSNILVDGKNVLFRELGSSMSSRWATYFPDCSAAIFIVDISDVGWYPNALVLLHEVLLNLFRSGEGTHRPLLIAFNKLDMCDPVSYCHFFNYFDVEEILSTNRNLISVVEGSCPDGSLCIEVLKWIRATWR